MATIDTLRDLADPIVDSLGLSIYDLEFAGGMVRLTVDRPGGVDLEAIAEVTRQVSRQLDLDDPIPGRYTLEVSSPGLERNLRTPDHWTTAVGERVKVKLKPGVDGERRVEGVVTAVDSDRIEIEVSGPRGDMSTATIELDDVERARTMFVWGPQKKPGTPGTHKESHKS